jgi:hypothetical protein
MHGQSFAVFIHALTMRIEVLEVHAFTKVFTDETVASGESAAGPFAVPHMTLPCVPMPCIVLVQMWIFLFRLSF